MAAPSDDQRVETLVEAVTTAKVFEERINLLKEIAALAPVTVTAMHQIAEALVLFWDENDLPQSQICQWRGSILAVARSQSSSVNATIDIIFYYMDFANKASMWLVDGSSVIEASLSSDADDSSINSTLELELEMLTYSCHLAATMVDCSALMNGPFVSKVEQFVKDSLDLVKGFCLQEKTKEPQKSILRAGQDLIGHIVKLVSPYQKRVCNSASTNETILACNIAGDDEKYSASIADGSSVVKSAVERLTELGSLCVSTGGTAIGLLNVSWKGVIALLQTDIGHKILGRLIDITKIIEILIAHAVNFISQGAEIGLMQHSSLGSKNCWISSRFFLVHAVKIVCIYPQEAFQAHKEILHCASKVMELLVVLTKDDPHLREIAETVNGTIAPISSALLYALLNANEINDQEKAHLIGVLTSDEGLECHSDTEEITANFIEPNIFKSIFLTTDTKMSRMLLAAGRFCLYLNLLQVSSGFSMNIVWKLSTRLHWLLNALSSEITYIYLSQVRCICVITEASAKPSWQLMFLSIVQALKTFATVAASSVDAWREIENFLFSNALHPNAVCRDLVLDFWSFILRHSTPSLVRSHTEGLSIIFDTFSSSACQLSDIHKESMSNMISMLVKATADSGLSWLIQLASSKSNLISQLSIMAFSCVLQESLYSAYVHNSLVEQNTPLALTLYIEAARLLAEILETRSGKDLVDPKKDAIRLMNAIPQCENAQIVQKLIDLTVNGFHFLSSEATNSLEYGFINIIFKVLSLVFDIQLNINNGDLMDRWLSLKDHLAMTAKTAIADRFKPVLACLLAVLSEIPFLQQDCDAVSDLYHQALKEKHWALIYAGLDSFGHFAARTACNELWRFVPLDAALSYDIKTGSVPNEERFTNAIRVFLEKELAQTSLLVGEADIFQMVNESRLHQQALLQVLDKMETMEPNIVQTEAPVNSVTSSFEDVQKAITSLQEGISVLKRESKHWLEDSNQNTLELEWFYVQIADLTKEIGLFQKLKHQRL